MRTLSMPNGLKYFAISAFALWSSVGVLRAEQVTVFAAASLKNALDEIADLYEESSGNQITAVYAGTAVLARQIEQGAPADVFISANPDWMDHLTRQDLIDTKSRRVVVANRLVLIAPTNSGAPVPFNESLDLGSMLDGGLIAMALVDAVPAGIYGKAALEHFGLWDGIAAQVAQADNVRAALAFVALGQTPLGIVYASDARAETRVHVLAEIPVESHPAILYPAGLVSIRKSNASAGFLDFLSGANAALIFEMHGFAVPGG